MSAPTIQVQNYALSGENNAAVFGFTSFVAAMLATKLTLEEQSLLTEFTEAVTHYQDELDKVSMTYGARVNRADNHVDDAWSAMNHQLKANILHYIADVRHAAEKTSQVFNRFENPTRMSFKNKYGILDRLITEMHDLPADVIEIAGVSGWLSQLEERVAAFRAIQQTKYETQNETEKGLVVSAREALIASYNEVVLQINARLVLHPTDSLIDAAQQWNGYIDEQKAIKKAAQTRKKKAADKAAAGDANNKKITAEPTPVESLAEEVTPAPSEVEPTDNN